MNNRYSFKNQDESEYYKLHHFLFNDEYRKGLSIEAKILYSLLIDKQNESIKNNWIDEEGNVYVLFPKLEIANELNVTLPTVRNAMKNLSEFNLLREVRQGLNKPNKLYVTNKLI